MWWNGDVSIIHIKNGKIFSIGDIMKELCLLPIKKAGAWQAPAVVVNDV